MTVKFVGVCIYVSMCERVTKTRQDITTVADMVTLAFQQSD